MAFTEMKHEKAGKWSPKNWKYLIIEIVSVRLSRGVSLWAKNANTKKEQDQKIRQGLIAANPMLICELSQLAAASGFSRKDVTNWLLF